MDPLTALSVACSALQLAQTAYKGVRLCQRLYEDGSVDEHEELKQQVDDLKAAHGDLKLVLQAHRSGATTRILRAADEVTKDADKLRIELNKLNAIRSTGLRRAANTFQTAIKALLKQHGMKELQDRLKANDNFLQSLILKDLYFKAIRAETEQQRVLDQLSRGQQTALKGILEGQKALALDFKRHVSSSENTINKHLDLQDVQLRKSSLRQELQINLMRQQELEERRASFMKVLSVPEMNDRRSTIEGRVGNFGDTYQWFFDPNRKDGMLSHSFLDWLQNPEAKLYAIMGRAGSGKSSALDFLYHELQPRRLGHELLQMSFPDSKIALLSFWFFRAGSSVLLRTLQGFWRSLCWQILNIDRTLFDCIRQDPEFAAPSTLRAAVMPDGDDSTSWTDKELRSWLEYLLKRSNMAFCILIDGLDEVEQNRKTLVDAVIDLSGTHKNVKICCSSRPDYPFGQLSQTAHLNLHELNFPDIQAHCIERLRDTAAQHLAKRIALLSEGIFLWASLVANNIAHEADLGADEEMLRDRLARCPKGITALFQMMLDRVDDLELHPEPFLPVLIADASIKVGARVSLLELWAATSPAVSSPDWKNLNGPFDTGFRELLTQRLERFAARVAVGTAGLFECQYNLTDRYIFDLGLSRFRSIVGYDEYKLRADAEKREFADSSSKSLVMEASLRFRNSYLHIGRATRLLPQDDNHTPDVDTAESPSDDGDEFDHELSIFGPRPEAAFISVVPIHRTVYDFLTENHAAQVWLARFQLSQDDVLARLITAVAYNVFFTGEQNLYPITAHDIATSRIETYLWEMTAGTRVAKTGEVMLAYFRQVGRRLISYVNPTHWNDIYGSRGFDLSTVTAPVAMQGDLAALISACSCGFTDFVELYMANATDESKAINAAFAWCHQAIRHRLTDREHAVMAVLRPYMEQNSTLVLQYRLANNAQPGSQLVMQSSRLVDHIGIMSLMCNRDNEEPWDLSAHLRTVWPTDPDETQELGPLESWIVNDSHNAVTVPAPDSRPGDIPIELEIFVFRIHLRQSVHPFAYMIDLTGWKRRGETDFTSVDLTGTIYGNISTALIYWDMSLDWLRNPIHQYLAMQIPLPPDVMDYSTLETPETELLTPSFSTSDELPSEDATPLPPSDEICWRLIEEYDDYATMGIFWHLEGERRVSSPTTDPRTRYLGYLDKSKAVARRSPWVSEAESA